MDEGKQAKFEGRQREFRIQDCALAAIATGQRAYDLRDFRDKMIVIGADSIYYHFWGGLLRPRFDDPEFHNDFAVWARYGLKDSVLAERLGIIDPVDFADIELLRAEVSETVEERLDELQMVPTATPENPFYFVRSQIVVFDTYRRLSRPEELAEVVPDLSLGSIFFHFVDARRRTGNKEDDFRGWLKACFSGYDDLCEQLSRLDPFFSGLAELKRQLSRIFRAYF